MRSTFLVQVVHRLQAAHNNPCRRTATRGPIPRMGWSSCSALGIWIVAADVPCWWSMHSPGGCDVSWLRALHWATLNWLGYAAWQSWGQLDGEWGCMFPPTAKQFEGGGWQLRLRIEAPTRLSVIHVVWSSHVVQKLPNSVSDSIHAIPARQLRIGQDTCLVYKHYFYWQPLCLTVLVKRISLVIFFDVLVNL